MANYYYRVDAVRPDQRAGDADFYRAPSKAKALEAFQADHPAEADWLLEAVKITKEEFPVPPVVPVVVVPAREGISEDLTDEQRSSYQSEALYLAREALLALKSQGEPDPRVRLQYPWDDEESADTCMLDPHDGQVIIVDWGTA